MRPAGLGLSRFCLIFGILVPATTTHPKLIALVRNKQNMYQTWCKAHVLLKKLTVKMGNNGRPHLLSEDSLLVGVLLTVSASSLKCFLISAGDKGSKVIFLFLCMKVYVLVLP